ncbi:MAG: diaminopimelate epimerase [Candidatus Omnitrophica bacterium]|nr:diaminopimelate epimerase [Candidatus Omnitrophota bacterium]MDE2009395.1 diaminopimelate epimerase [Candidatus Omnitrophota bacterium]MDE2214179.1 diaminopimelate epimerase [Candidatus Omnitrophota bacterium]
MVNVPFVKMVGAGNDFIIIDAHKNFDYAAFAKSVCARQNGIGADGVLILDKSARSDYRMRIINADGSEAEMCGNGARCMAVYIAGHKNPVKALFGMETLAGEILAEVQGETARVRLSNPKDYMPDLNITVAKQKLQVHYIDTGVPHTVLFVDGLQEVNAGSIGALIRNHPRFAPRGANVNFVERAREGMVAVRTYERGVEAETLACGTGAVASALVAYLHAHPKVKKFKGASMRVVTASKEILEITFDLDEGYKIDNVWLKGSAKLIAKGEYFYNG